MKVYIFSTFSKPKQTSQSHRDEPTMKQSEKGSYLHSKTEKIKQSSGGDTSHKPVRSLTKKPEIIEDSDDLINKEDAKKDKPGEESIE